MQLAKKQLEQPAAVYSALKTKLLIVHSGSSALSIVFTACCMSERKDHLELSKSGGGVEGLRKGGNLLTTSGEVLKHAALHSARGCTLPSKLSPLQQMQWLFMQMRVNEIRKRNNNNHEKTICKQN